MGHTSFQSLKLMVGTYLKLVQTVKIESQFIHHWKTFPHRAEEILHDSRGKWALVGAVILIHTVKPGLHSKDGTWLIHTSDFKTDCFKPALILQVGELWL